MPTYADRLKALRRQVKAVLRQPALRKRSANTLPQIQDFLGHPSSARTAVAPTRHAQVEGRDIFVFDGLIADVELGTCVEAVERGSFKRTEIARRDTAEYKHWVSEMPLAEMAQLPLWPATQAAVEYARLGETYRPYRAYTNYAAYGDMLFTHVDCRPHRRDLTVLWFMSTQWEPEWGGETMFFDTSGDAMFCVSPKPGRLVLFDGAILHAGRPPSRICYAPRYTFAIKLEPASAP